MTKKYNALFKLMTSLALILTLSFSLASSLIAADSYAKGTEEKPATAAITKILTMAEVVETPGETFSFTLTAKEVDGATATATNMPIIDAKTISFSSADTGAADGGIKTVAKETTTDVFAGVVWPHAGVYVYTVKETAGSTTGMSYSKAEYEIVAYVANGERGLYVAGIGAHIVVTDSSNEGSSEGAKVDPTPGGDPNVSGGYSKLIFTNSYVKAGGGGDPKDPDSQVLKIDMTVVGNDAEEDFGDRSKYFVNTLTVNKPALVQGEATYKAYVLEQGAVVTSAENFSGVLKKDEFGTYFEVKAGSPFVVNLKHGQQIVFTDLHIGASYIAVESAEANYAAQVNIIENGGSPVNLTNTAYNTERSTAPDTDPALERVVGEAANSASFINTCRSVTPTGVNVDDLPYFVMIIVALLAFAAYVWAKSRRHAKYAA